jgi:hypothetical protein
MFSRTKPTRIRCGLVVKIYALGNSTFDESAPDKTMQLDYCVLMLKLDLLSKGLNILLETKDTIVE